MHIPECSALYVMPLSGKPMVLHDVQTKVSRFPIKQKSLEAVIVLLLIFNAIEGQIDIRFASFVVPPYNKTSWPEGTILSIDTKVNTVY